MDGLSRPLRLPTKGEVGTNRITAVGAVANTYGASATATANVTVSEPSASLRCVHLQPLPHDRGVVMWAWLNQESVPGLLYVDSALSVNITSLLSAALKLYDTEKVYALVGVTAALLSSTSNSSTEAMRTTLISYVRSARSYQVRHNGVKSSSATVT